MDSQAESQHWQKCGENIRIAREAAGISVRELARRVNVSASHVSQVERGLASFSVPALYNVVSELGISMDSLFEDPQSPKANQSFELEQQAADGEVPLEDAGIVLRQKDRPVLELTKGPTWERLTTRPEQGSEFIEVYYKPAGGSSNPPSDLVRHKGREFGLVIEGELSVQVGMGFTILKPGDSIAFNCSLPHRFWNATEEPVRAVWFISELSEIGPGAEEKEFEYFHTY
jgi:transcriptional regulator with XRE-family HTH domain